LLLAAKTVVAKDATQGLQSWGMGHIWDKQ